MRLLAGHALLFLWLFTPGSAEAQSTAPAGDQSPATSGSLPPGWTARPDRAANSKEIKFVIMEPGYHLSPGPATILYRAEDRVAGPFHAVATFHQMNKPEHPEGYGIFFGGRALRGERQQYTYFLVRNDGSYLIKRRTGDATTEVTQGWIPHPGVKKGDEQGKSSNLLEIDAKEDPKLVRFKINGQTVYATDAKRLQLNGIVGLRINHNLDVHIQGFAVHQ